VGGGAPILQVVLGSVYGLNENSTGNINESLLYIVSTCLNIRDAHGSLNTLKNLLFLHIRMPMCVYIYSVYIYIYVYIYMYIYIYI